MPNHWYDVLVCKGAERLGWGIEDWAPITWHCSDSQWRFSYSSPERQELTELSHSLTHPRAPLWHAVLAVLSEVEGIPRVLLS